MDFHHRYFQPSLDQKGLVWVGRIAILILALGAYFMSVLIPRLLVTIGLLALSGTALVWKRSTTAGALTGLLVGVLLLAPVTIAKGFTPPFGMHSGLACFIVNLVLFVVVSLVTPPRKQEVLDRWAEQKAIYDRSS